MAKKKTGRPPKYTKKLGAEICRRISEGESVRSICRDTRMPGSTTIFRWLLDKTKEDFWKQYERARNIQAELMFEELLEIADESSNDFVETKKGMMLDKEAVLRSRLRVDTRKWYLSKVLPKKFGDKLDLSTLGEKLPTPILGDVSARPRDSKDTGTQ